MAAEADAIGVKLPPAGVALGSISIAQLIFNVLELVNTQVEAEEQSSDQIVVCPNPSIGKQNNVSSSFFIIIILENKMYLS